MKKKIVALCCVLWMSTLTIACAKAEDMAKTSATEQSMETQTSEVMQVSEESTSEEMTEPSVEYVLVGDIAVSDSPDITSEVSAMVEEVFSSNMDSKVVPVAYIGSQVVAGTNHYLLCVDTPNIQGARGRYVMVSIHEDLDGKFTLHEIAYSEAEAANAQLSDGWEMASSVKLTDEVKEAFQMATIEVNAEYTPIAFVEVHSEPPVSYGILCAIQGISEFCYINLQTTDGGAEIMEVYDFTASMDGQ